MRIHTGIAGAVRGLTRGALAIGNFDGVHLGHRGLFDATKASARRLGGPAAALTFEPHPARVLAPEYAPPLISSPSRKRELIAEAGVEELVVQPFDRPFAATEPERFVDLVAATIREFTLEGRVEAAAQLLGRPFDLEGDVVRGAGRGRKLGWPTANIRTSAELLPAVGVYAVRVRLVEPSTSTSTSTYDPPRLGPPIPGAANLGLNPTFRDDAHAGSRREPLMLEVHLFDVDQDLYGRVLRVQFVHRLRDERRFPNVEALKAQIARDVASARRLLEG